MIEFPLRTDFLVVATVLGKGDGLAPKEHLDDDGLGLRAEWRDSETDETLIVLVVARVHHAAQFEMAGCLPGDRVLVGGIAQPMELPGVLRPTVLIVNPPVFRIEARARQSWIADDNGCVV